MWVPSTAEEIETAVLAGDLAESSSFDVKRELPTAKKNVDLAVDVAAMSTDGGVLLFGIAEDDDGRPTVPHPLPLAGAPERIDQIVATSLAEVPLIDVKVFPLADDPSRGYIAVIVPQSARAPHQVTVGGDLRFYGRAAKGNRRLNEGEVARLYDRRHDWQVDRERLLDECVAAAPLAPAVDSSFAHAFVRPVAPDIDMWDRAVTLFGDVRTSHAELTAAAGRIRLVHTFAPSIASGGHYWHRQGADGWRLSTWSADAYLEPQSLRDPDRLAEVSVSLDGRGRMFFGRGTLTVRDDGRLIFETGIAGTVAAFIALMGRLYEAAGYHGAVDAGVAITNLEGVGSYRRHRGFQGEPYGASGFRRTQRFQAADLRSAEDRARDLLGRFLEAASGIAGYDPFREPG